MDRYVAGEPAVYVLRSTAKKHRAYVGFTTNMNQRLRRHNGEIAHGASATRAGRPWQVEIIVVGFGSRSMALSFEWALQHPNKAVATRGALRSMPRPGSFYRKLAIAQHAVTQAPFNLLPLRILQRGGAVGRWWEAAPAAPAAPAVVPAPAPAPAPALALALAPVLVVAAPLPMPAPAAPAVDEEAGELPDEYELPDDYVQDEVIEVIEVE
jgi:predicted GIY-YIG superfamily endonuclease